MSYLHLGSKLYNGEESTVYAYGAYQGVRVDTGDKSITIPWPEWNAIVAAFIKQELEAR